MPSNMDSDGPSSRSHSYERRGGDDDYGRTRRPRDHDSEIRRPNQPRISSHDQSDSRPYARPHTSSYRDDYDRRRPTNSKEVSPIPRPPMGRHDRDGGDYDRRRPPLDNRYNDFSRDYHASRPGNGRYNDPPARSSRPQRDRYDTDSGPPSRRRSPVRDYARDERRRRSPRRGHYDDFDDKYPPSRRRSADYQRDDRVYRDDRAGRRNDRSPRDDYERGYTSDHGGRDPARRNRYREDPPLRERDHYSERRPASGGAKNKGGFGNVVNQGQRYWKQAAPVAQPLLQGLAKAYLQQK